MSSYPLLAVRALSKSRKRANHIKDIVYPPLAKVDPNHPNTLLNHPLWMMYEVRLKISIANRLNSIPPPY